MTGGRGVTGSTDFAASFQKVGDALSALRHLNLPRVPAHNPTKSTDARRPQRPEGSRLCGRRTDSRYVAHAGMAWKRG